MDLLRHKLKKTASVQDRRLFLMMSKRVTFICSRSKKHRMFSEVCNMEADVMRLEIMLRHGGYPETKFQNGCFNCGNSWFSLLNKEK